ncbi:hypothetical protein QBC42DRAFT_264186, partial [Cladorrhinum samala]
MKRRPRDPQNTIVSGFRVRRLLYIVIVTPWRCLPRYPSSWGSFRSPFKRAEISLGGHDSAHSVAGDYPLFFFFFFFQILYHLFCRYGRARRAGSMLQNLGL